MVSRSLLLAGIVVLKWKVVNSVDAFSVRAVFALICNRILDITEATYWWTCWVAICAVHCILGLAAAYAAKENLEERSEGATRSEVLTAEDYWQATYGTFDPTVWTCKAGNLNKSLIRLISIRKAALSTVANMTRVCLLDMNHDTSWPLFLNDVAHLPGAFFWWCSIMSESWLFCNLFRFWFFVLGNPLALCPDFPGRAALHHQLLMSKLEHFGRWIKKDGASEYVSMKYFFTKKSKQLSMFKSCLNVRTPAMLVWKGTLTWKKAVGIVTLWWCRQFTLRSFHRGSDSALKQNKMKKTYKIWGAALTTWQKNIKASFTTNCGKNKQEQDHSPPILIRFLLLADEVGETIPKTSKLFWIERTKGVEDRWRILLHSTAALTRHLWTSICWICYGTKRSWERGMGRPGDLLRGWSRTRMNEKV